VIPPDYSLTPAGRRHRRAQRDRRQSQAIDALFGGPAPRSATETVMLDSGRRTVPPAHARRRRSATRVVDKGAATPAILAAPVGNGQDASATPGQ